MSQNNAAQILDPQMVELLTSHISIHVASSTDQNQVSLVRGVGCRVNARHDRITILVPRSQAEPVLRSIAKNGRIAAVFNQPETYRTVQFKGVDAQVENATAEDIAALPAYLRSFSERLLKYGVKEIYVHTLCGCEADDMAAISFSPLAAYLQTPGAEAGCKLPLGRPLP
ncbi:pyridoxamine 5'-phosphate oxidase family protein [Bowmanella sp. Y26]|uniref:Pyridoxamine 5'-phosphate oxidase family protein n=1 Tax=Bowmanella yangjiangensis TaxID=2811230 RepID=A0ABS3CTJ9_9ALTE|nr:pyridoxamine 5'-phosphate oxidase family protein [Bowmanella yangjiangensis]MBN7819466.1 pyridoxamine 5'-phosphate oxidase family protein [Bowmanella yangjiangensis]MBT1062372.1 pyridoxamine 5'-phosphate oxidase family protein [Bowmanella yangjiangensis]